MAAKREDPREKPHASFDHLERGLRAGYAKADASVLALLEERTGSSLRLSLPDGGGQDGPLVRPTRANRAGARYEILGEVARGGVGVVFEGRDVDLGRSVAIKVLHERFQRDPAVIERFVEEAQIGGQLQHPGIVPVYELGLQADDSPFFAMKLVKGDTLAELLRKRPSSGASAPRLLDVFLKICQTVAYAHSRRVIHRDLKPSNVLVGRFGEVQVLDWGLAKVQQRGGAADDRPAPPLDVSRIETVRSGEGSSASLAGSVMGTPAYMSPEQARGEIDRLDQRTDVFALGAVLFEILTGRALYESDDPGELLEAAADARQGPGLERLAASGVDPELVALARACVAPGPDARPSDAGELALRVEAYLASTEERARAAQVQAAVLRVRTRATVIVAALVLVGLLAGGAALLGKWERQRETTARAMAMMSEAERLAGQAEQAGLEGAALFDRALRSAHTAAEIVAAGEAEEQLAAQIGTRIEELERQENETRVAALREASHENWLERLREVRIGPDAVRYGAGPDAGSRRQASEAGRRVAEYAKLFGELEFDPASTPVDAADERFGCAHRIDIARGFDAWAEAERVTGVFEKNPSPESWRRLVRVARRLDPDHPWRNAIRDELVRGELDARSLAALAGAENVAASAPEEIALVIALLDAAGDLEGAVRTQLEAIRRHPTDFWLQVSFPNLVSSDELLGSRHTAESVLAISAAASLRPESRVARFRLALLAFLQGTAGEIMDRLRAEDPNSAVLAQWSFMMTMADGRFTEAADMLPDVLEDLRATDSALDHQDFILLHGYGDWLLEPSLPPYHRAYLCFGLGRYDEACAALQELRALSARRASGWYVYDLPRFRDARSPDELQALHTGLLSLAEADAEELAATSGPELLAAAEALAFGWRDLPAAVRLFAHAFMNDPALEERVRFVHARVEAGCLAALASADVSPGSSDLTPAERSELRELARGWLHAELDAIEDEISRSLPADDRSLDLSRTLNGLQVYGWPAPIRAARYLDQLEPEEATACRFLWARVKGVHRMFELMLDA